MTKTTKTGNQKREDRKMGARKMEVVLSVSNLEKMIKTIKGGERVTGVGSDCGIFELEIDKDNANFTGRSRAVGCQRMTERYIEQIIAEKKAKATPKDPKSKAIAELNKSIKKYNKMIAIAIREEDEDMEKLYHSDRENMKAIRAEVMDYNPGGALSIIGKVDTDLREEIYKAIPSIEKMNN